MSATLFVKFLGTALVVPAGYSAYSSGMLGGEFAADSDLDEGLASLAYIHMPDEDEEIEEPTLRADSEDEVKATVERAAESEVAVDAEEAVGSKAVETEARGDAVAEERAVETEAAAGAGEEKAKIIGEEEGLKEIPGKKFMSGLFGSELTQLLEEIAGEGDFMNTRIGSYVTLVEPFVGKEVPADRVTSVKQAPKMIPHILTLPIGEVEGNPSYADKYKLNDKLKDLDETTFLSRLNITLPA